MTKEQPSRQREQPQPRLPAMSGPFLQRGQVSSVPDAAWEAPGCAAGAAPGFGAIKTVGAAPCFGPAAGRALSLGAGDISGVARDVPAEVAGAPPRPVGDLLIASTTSPTYFAMSLMNAARVS